MMTMVFRLVINSKNFKEGGLSPMAFKKLAIMPLPTAPVVVDNRYRACPIKYILLLLVAAPIATGMYIAAIKPISPSEMRLIGDQLVRVLPDQMFRYGLGKPCAPMESAITKPIPIAPGDIVIDLYDGNFCEVLYLKVVETRDDYQVNVRLISLASTPDTDDEQVESDLSYTLPLNFLAKADCLRQHVADPQAYALVIGTDKKNAGYLVVDSGPKTKPKTVSGKRYKQIGFNVGDSVRLGKDDQVFKLVGLRLEVDSLGFYQLKAKIAPEGLKQSTAAEATDIGFWCLYELISANT